MKRIQIGDIEYEMCEHKDDINYMRFTMFKQYIPQVWEKMDVPQFLLYLDRIDNYLNQGKPMQARLELENYKVAINNLQNGYDAWSMCFALICLEEGEDQTKMDESFLQKKVKKWSDAGLSPSVVYDSVVDFMKASQPAFSAQLEMLTMMGFGTTPESSVK